MWTPSKPIALALTIFSGLGFIVSLINCDFYNIFTGTNLFDEIFYPFIFLAAGMNFYNIYMDYFKDEDPLD
jgi:hypothetical protein